MDSDTDLPLPRAAYLNYYIPILEGKLLHLQGKPDQSLKVLMQSLVHAPDGVTADLAEVYYFIGQNYRVLGDKINAAVFFDKTWISIACQLAA